MDKTEDNKSVPVYGQIAGVVLLILLIVSAALYLTS
jgi:hypothetical protein